MPKRKHPILLESRLYPVLSLPSLFQINGYGVGKMVVVIFGGAGSGKSILCHYLAHAAARTSFDRNSDGAPEGLAPLIVCVEEERLHSYNHGLGEPCPLAIHIPPSDEQGRVQAERVVAEIERHAEKAKRQNKIPFVIIDSVANVTGAEGNQRGWRFQGFQQILNAFDEGFLIIVAQARQGPNQFVPQIPSVPPSCLHRVNIVFLAKRSNDSIRLQLFESYLTGHANLRPIDPSVGMFPSDAFEIGNIQAFVNAIEQNKVPPLEGPVIGGKKYPLIIGSIRLPSSTEELERLENGSTEHHQRPSARKARRGRRPRGA